MVRAQEEPDHVRDHEPHEADHAGRRHGRPGHEGGGEEGDRLGALHVHPELGGRLLAQAQQIEAPAHQKEDGAPQPDVGGHDGKVPVLGGRKVPHEPEYDPEHAREVRHRGDEHDDGRVEGVEDHPHQQQGVDGDLPAHPGDGVDGGHGADRPEEREGGNRGDAGHQHVQAGADGQDSPEGRAARDPNYERIGQGIAQQGLEGDPGRRQGGADHGGQQHAREPDLEEYEARHLPDIPPGQDGEDLTHPHLGASRDDPGQGGQDEQQSEAGQGCGPPARSEDLHGPASGISAKASG